MQRTVLVYANCKNNTAKGDFSFGGNIAVDLKRAALVQNAPLNVVLVSTNEGIGRFIDLYGAPHNNQVTISGVTIGLSTLEEFDGISNHVVGYIDANFCKCAPSDIIKKVISPDCKLFYIGNANQCDWSEFSYMMSIFSKSVEKQPDLLTSFDTRDVMFASAGFGSSRLGMPVIASLTDLPELSDKTLQLVPSQKYGVVYFNARGYINNDLVLQYIQLSNLPHYLLIGDFNRRNCDIELACKLEIEKTYSAGPTSPVTLVSSLPNHDMRRMTANSNALLVATTGVNSSLEVMSDGKLPYYEFLDSNVNFVSSFLDILKQMASQNCTQKESRSVINLAELLFKRKPLSPTDTSTAKLMITDSKTCDTLVKLNKQVIASASGKLSSKLLSFLNSRPNNLVYQLNSVIKLLQSPNEKSPPDIAKALRRAAAQSQLFELKVLIKYILANPHLGISLNEADHNRKATALHWAANSGEISIVKTLLQAGASVDLKDKEGRKPIDIALKFGKKDIIRCLVQAGSRVDVDVDVVSKHDEIIGRFYNDCIAAQYQSQFACK